MDSVIEYISELLFAEQVKHLFVPYFDGMLAN